MAEMIEESQKESPGGDALAPTEGKGGGDRPTLTKFIKAEEEKRGIKKRTVHIKKKKLRPGQKEGTPLLPQKKKGASLSLKNK